ncbi:MAG: hypothetical protein Q8O67_02515 [Deltaproteobacteria bacterium]|nr:hypothetical protein [Deltaproteobacteria bacterium]
MNHDDDDDGLLSPRLRALLDEGSEGPALPAGTSDRLLARVLMSVGAATVMGASAAAATTTTAAATTAATTTTTATASSGLATALGFKIAVGLASVGAVIGGGVMLSKSTTTKPAAVVTLPPVRVPVAAAPVIVEEPALELVLDPLPVSKPAAKKIDVVIEAPKLSATEEAALLERARAALSRADTAAAFAAIAEHAARAPRGQLVEEREGLRVLTLVRAGRSDEAARAGESFLRLFPDSLMAERVRAATVVR